RGGTGGARARPRVRARPGPDDRCRPARAARRGHRRGEGGDDHRRSLLARRRPRGDRGRLRRGGRRPLRRRDDRARAVARRRWRAGDDRGRGRRLRARGAVRRAHRERPPHRRRRGLRGRAGALPPARGGGVSVLRVLPHTRLDQLAGGKKGSQEALAKLGLHTVGDLLHHHPRRYIAKGELSTLADVEPDTHVSVVGRVVRAEVHPYQDRRTRQQAWRVELVVAVEGERLLLTFFDRRKHIADWRIDRFQPGTVGIFSGKLGEFRGRLQLTHPDATLFGTEGDAAMEFELQPDLTPVYPASAKVQTWQLRDLVKLALELLDDWPEVVPRSVRRAHGLVTGRQAVEWIHRPADRTQVERAAEYFKFAEAFTAQTL